MSRCPGTNHNPQVDKMPFQLRAIKISRGRRVSYELPNVLADAASNIQIFGTTFDAVQHGRIAGQLAQVEAEEAE